MWATFMYCPCPWEPGVRFSALELQAVVNLLMWVLGTEPVSSGRSSSSASAAPVKNFHFNCGEYMYRGQNYSVELVLSPYL